MAVGTEGQNHFTSNWNQFQLYVEDSGRKVLLKSLMSNNPGAGELARYENELFYAEQEPISGVRTVYGAGDRPYSLKLEWVNGVSLDKWNDGTRNLEEKLQVCYFLTEILIAIHSRGIIYKNLSPENIIVTPDGKPVIIDMSLATSVVSRSKTQNAAVFNGDINFISPEQTGRINRLVDHRSDLYSLGAVFYYIFSEKVPFPGVDMLEKVHAHIAINPIPLTDSIEKLPVQLSTITTKLLSKSPDTRYQSAYGLLHDLRICLDEYTLKKTITEFELQTKDFHGDLVFSNRLYGRDKEFAVLLEAFESSKSGHKEFVCVSGYSGIGKTALINELYEPVFKSHGMLVSGKFEKYQRDIPYFGFKNAIREFIHNIKALDSNEIKGWKETIELSLHPVGRVLTDLIPELDFLAGEQPELPELNGPEAQNRFNYVMLSFIKAIAVPGSPLVVFLDDVQWADSSSIQLLKVLMADSDLKNLMIVCAYRSNEVSPDHAVSHLINDLEKANHRIHQLKLENLGSESVAEMLTEILQIRDSEKSDLTDIVFKKSQGNALFIQQFLKAAKEEGILKFDYSKRIWSWDSEKLLRQNLGVEIEDLLNNSIERLPEKTRFILTKAACIGNSFYPGEAAKICGIPKAEFRKFIKPALVGGLLLESGDIFLFGHDKIQQVLYESIPADERVQTHLKIAELLSEEEKTAENIFDLVFHWNNAKYLVSADAGKLNIAELNLEAGLKARNSVAFNEALQYFQNALEVLPPDHWKSYYQISIELGTHAAEASYLSGRHDLSEEYVELVVANAVNVEDKSKALIYRIRAYTAENKVIEAIETGYGLLSELGVKIPKKPGKLSIIAGLISTGILLKRKSADSIMRLPEMTDKRTIIIMDVIYGMFAPAYFAMPDFLPIGVFKMIRLTLKYGLGPKSPFCFLGYGYIHSAFLGNIVTGTKFGNIGFSLHKMLDTKAMSSTFYGIYYALTNHWTSHMPDTISGLKEGFKYGLETGDIEYTSYLAHNIIYHSLYSGISLPETLNEGISLYRQIESFNVEVTAARVNIFLQSIQDLIETPENIGTLEGEFFSEKNNKYKPEKQNHILFHNLYFQKMFVSLIYGKNTETWENILETEYYNESVQGSALFPLFNFYRILAITGVYDKYPEKQSEFRRKIKIDLKKLKKYMIHSPKNFDHKYWLCMAELARVSGEIEKAQLHYFKALRKARQSRLLQDEAIAWERAGEFYLAQGQEQVGDFYINNAFLVYKRWGAAGKLNQLLNKYPRILSGDSGGQIRDGADNMDLATVVKAYNAIAGEIIMSELLEKLMHIMIENAGAQRGVLIREEGAYRTVVAVLDEEDGKVEVLLDEPVQKNQRLSQTVLNFAANSKSYVVLENACETRPYNRESYIREGNIKSVICMPVIQKGKKFGYLYLENNLVTGAFTKSRISLLSILSAQAAVSLENAELYDEMSQLNTQLKNEISEKEEAQQALIENEKRLEEYNENLEQKVEERTRELSLQKDIIEQEKKKSDSLLLNILPEETAEELKAHGKAEPRRFKEVTVLFTDFVDFSRISESVTADVLVNEIHYYYCAFDEIISKYKLEKIKTIGDSYMCAAGLPVEMKNHAENAVRAALEIQNFIREEEKKRSKLNQTAFDIRIGLHTGPVVAGIVGIKKFAYDIWGDTVNYASRMESSGKPGRVNISGSTYELIKDKFECEHRGKIAVKSKGEIDMYFVNGFK